MVLGLGVSSVRGQAIDFYNLDADYVKCEIGPYAARSNSSLWVTQRVNFGADDIRSRHAVHDSSTEVDARTTDNGTKPGLHTVPSGEMHSVRLGNWLDGRVTGDANETGQAERITYTFEVTEENKYLLMRYAIVWQDPHNHNDIVPSFQVETFLGATGNTIIPGLCYNFEYDAVSIEVDQANEWSTQCRICAYQRFGNEGNYYYYANRSSQNAYGRVAGYYYQGDNAYSTYYYGSHQQTCPESTWRHEDQVVAWRDWRTRIINLEDYVGQTVRLRFTSSDCGYVEHWGYCYYTLRCLDVNLYSPTCGNPTETRTFTAPEGLEYIWYKVKDDHSRLSLMEGENSNTLTVLNDGQMYECCLVAPENKDCKISLYAKAEPRVPMSDFEIQRTNACVDTIILIDRSCVSKDGVTPLTPHEDVDQIIWDLGDGRVTSVDLAGVKITYAHDGTYTIKQTTRLITGAVTCEDVKTQTITVRGRETKHEGVEYDTICAGEVKHWNNMECRKTGTYSYTIEKGASNGYCDSIATLHLKVWDKFTRNDTLDVREGKDTPYPWHRDGALRNLYTSGVYYDSCTNIHGCDSVYKLVLCVHPMHYIVEKDTICDGESYAYHKNGVTVNYTQGGVYYDSLLTKTYGNDSVYCLQLHVLPSPHFSETRSFCKGDTVDFHGERFWTDGPHSVTFKTTKGCDSVFTLVLKSLPTYIRDTVAIITDQQTPFLWHGKNRMSSGVYFDSLKTVAGCDSVVRLQLTVNPTYFYSDLPATICQGESYNFHDTILTTPGTYLRRYKSRFGTDSVYQITLTVKPRYETIIHADCPEGGSYNFMGTTYTTGGVYSYTFTENATRCDSVVKLVLAFHPKYYFNVRDTICQGDSYTFHKNGAAIYYTSTGVYWDSLKTTHGYDSVYRLELHVNPSYHYNETFTVCRGDTLKRHGRSFTEADTYVVPFTTRDGCDSIITLTLKVNPSYDNMINRTICEGEYVVFDGQSRTVGGVYTEKRTTENGCDSITRLNLTVNPVIRIHEDVHLCGGDAFFFRGEYITSAGIYADTLSSALTGCDSIRFYHVYVHPSLRDTTHATICQGEQYFFHGNTFSTAGMHVVTGQSVFGCDSSYVLMLTVRPVYHKDTTFTLCHGDNISLFGRLYTSGGEYRDTLKTIHGCDSVYAIHIREYPKFFESATYALCKGDNYTWRGQIITEGGVYYDSLNSVHGCDSVYQLTVNMRNTYHTTLVETILSTGYYDFNGRVLRESGIYYEHFVSEKNGCDSLVELRLTVLPVYEVDETHEMCDGETFVWHGQHLTETGNYTATLRSVHNTDSVVHLALTVYKPLVRTLPTVHISDKESYTWQGQTYSATGTYEHHSTSVVTGCDSITRLRLVVHPTYHWDEYYTICDNHYFTWNKNGSSYNTAGTYTYNPRTYNWNYDSVYVLHLAVKDTYIIPVTAHICEGESYSLFGRPLTEGGFYTDTVPTQDGSCDSIVQLTLIKHAVYSSTRSHVICHGDTYDWHGRPLTTQGIYYDTLRSVQTGCDSIHYMLNLSVRKPFYEEQVSETCAGQPFSWRGRSYNATGVYWDSLHSVYAPFCDSVYCLKLTVYPRYEFTEFDTICEGEWREFGGVYYNTGGFYTRTLATIHGCDSIRHLNLVVRPISRIERYVDLCDGEVYSFHGKDYTLSGTYIDTTSSVLTGCDSITTYRVGFHPVVRDTLYASTCQGSGYAFYGQLFYNAGEYSVGGQSGYGCDSVHVLRLTVHPTYEKDTVFTLCSGDNILCFGKVYSSGGTYYDTLHTVNGCDSIYTIRINEYPHSYTTSELTLCKGDSVEWRGHWIKQAGTYYDTIHHASGCDDIYQLTVKLKQPAYQEIEATVPSTSYYDFNGRILREDGIYYDTLTSTLNECDSIVRLKLTVTPKYFVDDLKYICEGGAPYDFNGQMLDEPGIYSTTYHPRPGVDSTVTLNFTVYKPVYHESVAHISDQEHYSWKGHELTQTGIYDSTYISTITGCDSIERLKLYVHNTFRRDDYYTMCDGERYSWRKYNGLSETGVYYDSLQTQTWNYDSVYILHLNVNPVYRHDTTVHLCAGEVYEFGGNILTSGGHYYDTISTATGCDSTFSLTLIKHPTYLREKHQTICSGDSYTWRGKTLTEGGVYDDSLTTVWGCDSIERLYLDVHRSFYQELQVDLCEGEYYVFNGRPLNKAGVYWDSLTTRSHRCDSVSRLDLRVHGSAHTELRDTICGADHVMFGGRALYEGGTYTDSLLTIHGCDSVVTMRLTKFPIGYTRTVHTICRGDEVEWTQNGVPFSTSVAGVYADTMVSVVSGCDSISELILTVHNQYYQEYNGHICSNSYYDFHGRLLNESGIYWDSLTTVHTGCDSVFRLELEVQPAYQRDTTVYLCDWETFYFRGKPVVRTGTYYDSLRTASGCDSIHVLHAYVQASRRDSMALRLCAGEEYDFSGRHLTTDGIYRDTVNDPLTRQCVISTRYLTFAAPTRVTGVRVEDACADDASFGIHSYYIGARPQTYSIVFDEMSHRAGFEDLWQQPYSEYIEAPIPQREGDSYIRPDYYHATLMLDNSVCLPDDSATIALTLLVRYPSWIIEQNWNDVVALLNEQYNGGYLFSAYQWYVNGNLTGEQRPYIYMPQTLRPGDEVVVAPVRKGEEYAVPSCPIVIYDKSSEQVSEYPVLCTPVEKPGRFRIAAAAQGVYWLYSLSGSLMTYGSFRAGDNMEIDAHAPQGCYLLRLTTPSHGNKTIKLLLR